MLPKAAKGSRHDQPELLAQNLRVHRKKRLPWTDVSDSFTGKMAAREHGERVISPKSFENVHVSFLKEDGSVETVSDEIPFKIEISQEKTNTVISILNGEFAYLLCQLLICSRQQRSGHIENAFAITFSSVFLLNLLTEKSPFGKISVT